MTIAANSLWPPGVRSPARRAFHDAEELVLGELETVRAELRRAGAAAVSAQPGLVAQAIELAGQAEQRHADIHERMLCLMAQQAPVAGDLRLAVALIAVNDRLARVSAQAVNIATLCREMSPGTTPPPDQLSCLERMVELADRQLHAAGTIFATRDVDGVVRLRAQDRELNLANRRCFALAVERGEHDVRQAVFFVALMARAIERVGDNAVEIARQAAFVADGRLRRDAELRGPGALPS